MQKRIFISAAILLSIVVLSACRQKTDKPAPISSSSSFMQIAALQSGDHMATLKTSFGSIVIKLFPEQTPETVKNFEELSKRGFYNGLTFHRVIPDFMIQGGDPRGDGTGGETYKGSGTTLPDEFSPDLKNLRGALSMANRGKNTGTSQFFIVQAKDGTPWLNGKHTVFGQVMEGMDVVDAIANAEADPQNRPKQKIEIMSVETEILK